MANVEPEREYWLQSEHDFAEEIEMFSLNGQPSGRKVKNGCCTSMGPLKNVAQIFGLAFC